MLLPKLICFYILFINVSKSAADNRIITKEQWGGQPPLLAGKVLKHPTNLVIISHTATPLCKNFESCSPRLQSIQAFHMNSRGLPDIGYNFLIDSHGNIYEGRGWDTENFHTKKNSIGISFIGNYIVDQLALNSVDAAISLLKSGVKNGKLAGGYTLVCHNQTTFTESPGKHVYKTVKDWPHFNQDKLF